MTTRPCHPHAHTHTRAALRLRRTLNPHIPAVRSAYGTWAASGEIDIMEARGQVSLL